MKKIISILAILNFNIIIATEVKQGNNNSVSEFTFNNDDLDAVMCCTRRGSTGTYGQAGYSQVVVTTCATSPISYQDAQQRACSEADAKVKKSLEIAANTNETVTIK